jgi:hypothetical protein
MKYRANASLVIRLNAHPFTEVGYQVGEEIDADKHPEDAINRAAAAGLIGGQASSGKPAPQPVAQAQPKPKAD